MLDISSGFDAYKNTSVQSKAAGSDSRQLIVMLISGFLDELDRLQGHIERKRYAQKASSMQRLLNMLGGLDAALDPENTTELAENLRNLYDYCGKSLVQVSLKNDINGIESVRTVMTNLQQGWQGS